MKTVREESSCNSKTCLTKSHQEKSLRGWINYSNRKTHEVERI